MTARGPAILLAVFVTASGHGSGRYSPLSASMGSVAGEPGVRCGRVWRRLLSPSLLLSLKCDCSVSSPVGGAASSFLPVVNWSGHSIG